MSSRFNGFEAQMFDFFARHNRDSSDTAWIRGRMELFGQKLLYKGLQSLDSDFYRAQHVGVFHPEEDETFWVAFGSPKLEHLLNTAHQTVSLSASGLDVYVRVGSVAAIDLLRRKLSFRRQEFLQIVNTLPEPFEVQVRERTRVAPMRFLVSAPRLRVAPADVRDPSSTEFAKLVKLLSTIDYPHFSVRSNLTKQRVLELGGNGLLDEVLAIMKSFQPLVVFLNEDEMEVLRLEAQLEALRAQIDRLDSKNSGGGEG